jgi:hypothetical protein
MAKPKTDPLLAALIAKLPAAGTEWPVERQLAWLQLMAMAFGTVYGGDAVGQFGGKPPTPAPAKPKPTEKPDVKFARLTGHNFMIDMEGYVRRANGDRVLPADVVGSVFDTRGALGDLRTIVWADNSIGLNGKDLVISS